MPPGKHLSISPVAHALFRLGARGWYNGATSLDTATKVTIRAHGTRRIDLTLR